MTAKKQEPAPIACTLSGADFRSRLAWIADLNRGALRTHRREGLRLELTYDGDAVDRVREMVRREQACCAFMTFDVHEDPESVRLTITVPEEARAATDDLFQQFQSTGGLDSGGV